MKGVFRFRTVCSFLSRAASATLTAAVIAACGGGGGSGSLSSSGGGGGSSNASSAAITITAIFPTTAGPTWAPILLNNMYFIKGLQLTINGTCSRGIVAILVNEGGANYPQTATCTEGGTFSWQKTYQGVTGEGNKTLNLLAQGVAGTVISGAGTSVQVRIDNTPPNPPTITSPTPIVNNAYTYNSTNPSFTISGTATGDTAKITGPNGFSQVPSSGTWSYHATLVPDSPNSFTFFASDIAGNVSAGAPLTVNWNPTIVLVTGGALPGQIVVQGSGNSSTIVESTLFTFTGQINQPSKQTTVQTGFNYIINKARGL